VFTAVGAAVVPGVVGAAVTVAVGVVFTSVLGLSTQPDKNAPISTAIKIIPIFLAFIFSIHLLMIDKQLQIRMYT
jgi:hypothetical protein